MNQFENVANYRTHAKTTRQELWDQMDGGHIDVIFMSSETGYYFGYW